MANDDDGLREAYVYLRKAIGLIAVGLPFVLAGGHLAFGADGLCGSISAYYYTHMGNVFVGALCALAVFFLSYNYKPLASTWQLDRVLSRLAAVAAIGVALFPTLDHAADPTGGERIVSTVHLLCAASLFGLLGVFARFRFTKSSGTMTPQKVRRNRLYRRCGNVIFASMALVIVSIVIDPPESWNTLFWFETACVEAFGFSWLVKGGFLGWMADPAPDPAAQPA